MTPNGSFQDYKVSEFLDAVAERHATPGGGCAAASAGAIAAALTAMVCRFSLGQKGLEPFRETILQRLEAAEKSREELAQLIDRDAEAYGLIMAAFRLPAETPADRAARNEAIQKAHREATETPLRIAVLCLGVMELVEGLIEHHNRTTTSDLGVAASLALAGLEGAAMTVSINLRLIADDSWVRDMALQIRGLVEKGRLLKQQEESRLTQLLVSRPGV